MNWYVLMIQPSKARAITEKLLDMRVTYFYPQRTIWRKRRVGPRQRRDTPLMPCYIMVAIDIKRRGVRSILSIKGVTCFLGHDGVPQHVPGAEVERMQASVARGEYDETLQRIAQIVVGTSLSLVEGPLAGHSVTVTAIKGKRAEIAINGGTSITIAVDKLEKSI
jgi:transcription antitermination factor NusG